MISADQKCVDALAVHVELHRIFGLITAGKVPVIDATLPNGSQTDLIDH